jgi:hypothetical protein
VHAHSPRLVAHAPFITYNRRPHPDPARRRSHSCLNLVRRRYTHGLSNRRDGDVALATVLDFLAVHARSRGGIVDASADLVAALVVDVFDVEGVDVAGEIAGEVSRGL